MAWSETPEYSTQQQLIALGTGSAPYSLLEQPRFRAGFDFLRLRAQTGEIDLELAEWWEKFSTAYDDERHAMIEEARQAQLQKPQAPRVRVKRPDAEAGTGHADRAERGTPDAADASGEQGDAAPAKKRRRRRKPANRGSAGGAGDAGGEGAGGDSPSPSADAASNS